MCTRPWLVSVCVKRRAGRAGPESTGAFRSTRRANLLDKPPPPPSDDVEALYENLLACLKVGITTIDLSDVSTESSGVWGEECVCGVVGRLGAGGYPNGCDPSQSIHHINQSIDSPLHHHHLTTTTTKPSIHHLNQPTNRLTPPCTTPPPPTHNHPQVYGWVQDGEGKANDIFAKVLKAHVSSQSLKPLALTLVFVRGWRGEGALCWRCMPHGDPAGALPTLTLNQPTRLYNTTNTQPDLRPRLELVAKFGIRLSGGYHIDLSPGESVSPFTPHSPGA